MKKLLFIFLFLGWSAAQAQENILVMIPGFFNYPQGSGEVSDSRGAYFSKVILATIREWGYSPEIIDNLNPVGTLAENSQLLQVALQQLVADHPQANFKVIAHSAGGLYLADVLTRLPDLPFHTVVTIATPYAGVRIVDILAEVPGFKKITAALDLRAVREFKSANMPAFISQLRLPAGIRWIALGAAQPVCELLTCLEAQYQPWLFSMIWQFAGEPGDGVVSTASATATGLHFLNNQGAEAPIERWDFVLPLDHWDQTLDPPLIELMGVINSGWVGQEQALVYNSILSQI
jgi:hypothetical protein